MARCTECFHYAVCAKEGRLVQVDEHTWDDYNQLDNVEQFCDNYVATADVVPKSEVAREIFEEIDKELDKVRRKYRDYLDVNGVVYTNYARTLIAELKKKYTEAKSDE